MILSLHVRNIALIEDVTMHFGAGMHVMTGETGAGKSIVVDAVNLVLGGRADRDLIRTGTDRAWVEAEFDTTDNAAVAAILAEQEIEYDGAGVMLYREISRTGRNICRINGMVMPVSVLKSIADILMDVHGQHEHQFLMDPMKHLAFLDASGDVSYDHLMKKTADACAAFLKNHRAYAKLVRENEQKNRRLKELEESLAELRKAKLKVGEEEALTEERNRARSAQLIVDAINEASSLLSAAGEDESVLTKLRQASHALHTISKLGEPYASFATRLESLSVEAQELNYDLAAILENDGFNPERIEFVERRLDLIRRLERKYGATIEDVLFEQKEMEAEYERLTSMDNEVAAMREQHRTLLAAYRAQAAELSRARHTLAERFEKRLMAHLADLGMEKLIFRVAFAPPPEKPQMPRPVGDDSVEFMISPNPGEPLKPLSKIASGGELSRIMLAIKSMEAEKAGVGTMVFDEIDTGISGRMAQAVAEKMAVIARSRQVICVTHLPQLAAMAAHQFLIEKSVIDGRTVTQVTKMDRDLRIHDIARMLSGTGGSDESAMEHAAHMLDAAEKLRNE